MGYFWHIGESRWTHVWIVDLGSVRMIQVPWINALIKYKMHDCMRSRMN